MVKISVVCWSRASNPQLLLRFLHMLECQTFKDFDVNIVCDRGFENNEEKNFLKLFATSKLMIEKRLHFFTNNNSEFNPNHWWWASYVRNFWIERAKWKYIQLFDDDNEVNPDFLEECLKKYENIEKHANYECIILPSLYYRDTNKIQNQWFSYFSYRQSRPIIHLLNWKRQWEIQMFSGNWIFWLADTLRKAKYDEQIAWISEDLDYTLSLHEQWVHLWVFSDLKVRHYERNKNKLEQARIWSYSQAKQKARNWFLFTNKHWNQKEIRQFYLCWLPWCVMWLSIKALLFWRYKWFKIIRWLFAWIREWWMLTHKK